MFTGLVQDLGTVESFAAGADGARLRIATTLAGEVADGDSVAVEGCCLTATAVGEAHFEAEAMNQTLAVTTIGGLKAGDRVNLELAMRASDRLGGHIVQGHVDGVAEVLEQADDGFARRLRFGLPDGLGRYAIAKGSIAIAGVSLTVAELGPDWVEVSLIPETRERTTLGGLAVGERVNVEVDLLAKHAERLLSPWASERTDKER